MKTSTGVRSRTCLVLVTALSTTAAVVAGAAFAAGDGQPDKTATVRLVIDYADGVETHFTAIPLRKKMTVLDAMRTAAKHPRGVVFEHRGDGATALVTRIGDLKNAGGGRDGKNWIYRVNDELADRSAGAYELKPDDVVRWRYETYSTK